MKNCIKTEQLLYQNRTSYRQDVKHNAESH